MPSRNILENILDCKRCFSRKLTILCFLLFGRLALSVLPETDNSHSQSPSDSVDNQSTIHASPLSPSLSTDPFGSFGMFSDLHSSLAPAKPPRAFSELSESSMENLSAPKSEKRKAPLPPGYLGGSSKTESHPDNGGQAHTQNSKDRPVLPLPDYEILYPKKRHGVMGQTHWDHLVAEVNQRNWDFSEEINVDGPERLMPNKSVILKDRTSVNLNQHQRNHEAPPPAPARHKQALVPPKAPAIPEPSVETNVQHGHIRESLYTTVNKPRNSASKNLENNPPPSVHSRPVPQEMERKSPTPDAITHQLSQSKEKPTPAARSIQNINPKTDDVAKEMPSVKPRQQSLVKDPVRQVQPDKQVTNQPMTSENNKAEKPQKGSISTDGFDIDLLKVQKNCIWGNWLMNLRGKEWLILTHSQVITYYLKIPGLYHRRPQMKMTCSLRVQSKWKILKIRHQPLIRKITSLQTKVQMLYSQTFQRKANHPNQSMENNHPASLKKPEPHFKEIFRLERKIHLAKTQPLEKLVQRIQVWLDQFLSLHKMLKMLSWL